MKKIAFVGNPNVGKSAWINALSNAKFKVGNWAGVSVDMNYVDVHWKSEHLQLIDLPGIYSLRFQSNEEVLTKQFLEHEHIDVIVNVVDATNLSSHLLLTLELRRLQIPMLIIFNFMDEVKKFHTHIQVDAFIENLGLPVCACSVFDKQGVESVKEALLHMSSAVFYTPLLCYEEIDTYDTYRQHIEKHLPSYVNSTSLAKEWFYYDAYIGDEQVHLQLTTWQININKREDSEVMQHHRFIQELMVFVEEREDRYAQTKRIDQLLLHPLWGNLCLIVMFFIMMIFVFQGSAPFNDFIDFLIQDMLMKYVQHCVFFLPESAQQLLLHGVVGGVGGVLVFLPLMAFLTFFLSMLEESGYMARMAFLLDPFMQKFHLNGKSFVALLLGFGCNVPALYATRTIGNKKQRYVTALLVPFMSCGARLPVYMLFAAAFFPSKATMMVISIYGIGIFVALLLAMLSNHVQALKEDAMLLIELPPYRLPNVVVIVKKVKEEIRSYIKKAMRVVLWAMIALWCLSYFPHGNISTSYISQFAKSIAPMYEPLGFGTRWESVAALPGSMIAKETIVGFFGQVLQSETVGKETNISPYEDVQQIVYEAGKTLKKFMYSFSPSISMEPQEDTLISKLSTFWQDEHANLRAYCYMVYILLSIPCVMTLFAMYKECGFRLMLLSIFLMLILPYIVTFLIYQLFANVL